jgi:drug/metabolite transporter (DMT)-like permease
MRPTDIPDPRAARPPAHRRETLGLWLGLLGVVIFSMTLPMTRLAVGAASDPQLPPLFVTAGRAAFAGLLSLVYLRLTGAPLVQRRHVPALLLSALGTVVGFPLLLSLALREVDAMHAAVGCAMVLAFAAWRGSGRLSHADGLLLLAVVATAVGYVSGARVAAELPGEQVICWVLVLSLPLTLPVALAAWPAQPVRASAWGGFAYVTLFSMWLGFFAWYRGLALGGTVRVSQVQLVQPFLALLFAVPVLGETLDATTVLFSLAVIAVVFASRKMPAHRAPAAVAPLSTRRSS